MRGIDFGAKSRGRARDLAGIWRGRGGSTLDREVPHGMETEKRWGRKTSAYSQRPAGNGRHRGFQPGEELSAGRFSLSISFSAMSSLFPMWSIFSQLTKPYNTCSQSRLGRNVVGGSSGGRGARTMARQLPVSALRASLIATPRD
jgi:hypothetical protein